MPTFESLDNSLQSQILVYPQEQGEGCLQVCPTACGSGVDLSHDLGNAMLNVEYAYANSPQGDFNFIFGKLSFTKAGRFTPYLGAYYWRDWASELGSFNSMQVGLANKPSSHFSLEGFYSHGNSRDIFSFQSDTTF